MERFGSFGELIENPYQPVILSSHIPVDVSTFTSGSLNEDVVSLWHRVTAFVFLGASVLQSTGCLSSLNKCSASCTVLRM